MLSVAVAGLGDAAHLRILRSVDHSFRGTYDILVRPRGSESSAETRGLVESNFLGVAGSEGISVAQWRAVQALPDVEVAAPIAAVGLLRSTGGTPTIAIPYARQSTFYRISFQATTGDGVQTVLLAREDGLAYVEPPHGERPPTLNSTFLDYSGDGSRRGASYFTVTRFPVFAGLVVAVDPRSEDRLLHRDAFESMSDLPPTSLLNTDQFPIGLIPSQFRLNRGLILLTRSDVADQESGGRFTPKPVVPLALNADAPPSVRLSWRVWRVDGSAPLAPHTVRQNPEEFFLKYFSGQEPVELIIDRSLTLSHFGLPLTPTTLELRPVGPPALGGGARDSGEFLPVIASRPSYAPTEALAPDAETPSFRVLPLGPAPAARPTDPTAYHSYAGSGLRVSFEDPQLEQTYRRLSSASIDLPTSSLPAGDPLSHPYYLAPVGSFALGELDLPHNPLNYAPLGAYDPADTDLTSLPDGTPLVDPVPLRPSFNPAGFIVSAPAAFTTIGGAVLLRGQTPIDAIRVRVAGVTGFDRASQSLLASVASRIRAMGMRVDIIAGSSPQEVSLYLPQFLLAAQHEFEDLGWVRQNWTTVGAAAQVETGLTDLTLQAIALALAATLIFSFFTQHLSIRAQRKQIALVRALGWKRRDVSRLLLRSASLVAITVTAAGLAAGVVWRALPGRCSHQLWWTPSLVGLAWLVATPSAIRSTRRVPMLRDAAGGDALAAWFGRRSLQTVTGYAIRQAFRRWRQSLPYVVALGVGSGAVGLVVAFLSESRERGGPTALGASVATQLHPMQLLVVVGSAMLFVVATVQLRKADIRSRAAERSALWAIGWRPNHSHTAARVEDSVVGGAAALLAGGFIVVLGAAVGIGAGGLMSICAIVALCVPASNMLIGALLHRRID